MAKEVVAGLFQIVVAILGAVIPVVVERLRRPPARPPGTQGGIAPPKPEDERHLLDLSVLLIYGAFLSAILSHSIFISGREPSFSAPVLGGVALIAGATGAVLYFAWRKNFGETTAGAMSLAALIVLLIAPGNITYVKEDPGLEAGLPLLLPVLTLTFATSVVGIYLFGNPLGREHAPKRRRNVGIALMTLALITASILGYDFIADSIHHRLAPKFHGTDEEKRPAEQLLARMRALDLAKRGELYRLASDSALAATYRAAYFKVRSDVEKWDDTVARIAKERGALVTPIAATPTPAPLTDAATDFGTDQPAAIDTAGDAAAAEAALGTFTATDTAFVATDDTGIDDATVPSEPESSVSEPSSSVREAAERELTASGFLGPPLGRDEKLYRKLQISRLQFLSTMSRHVEALNQEALIAHIDGRLPFIHATPLPPRYEQVMLLMPGTSAERRYAVIDALRIKRFTGAGNALPWEDGTFRYSDSDDEYELALLRLEEPSQVKDEAQIPLESVVFPREIERTDPRFALQLALPRQEEAYVHYRSATMLALSLLDKEEADLAMEFDKLPAAERWAFAEFVAPLEHDKNLKLLSRLAQSKVAPAALPATADARYDVAARLQRSQANACADANETAAFCQWMQDSFGAAERTQIAELITQADRNGATVAALFSPNVLKFVTRVSSRRTLLDVIADPVTAAMSVVAGKKQNESDWLPKAFEQFKSLTPKNREGILWHLAVMLYRAEGPNSLNALPLLALQAHSVSPTISFAGATLLMLPGTIAAIAFGGFAARKLVERDRTRALVVAEKATGQVAGDIGLPVDLLGREGLLDRIRKLGGRGWSTIAVVGRRGIGKSRLLYELFKPASPASAGAVSVWIPAPTNYDEAEFVESVFERLALRTERAVADQLQAKPLPVRLLERRQAQAGMWMFATAFISLAVLLTVARVRTFRPELMATWVPILILAAVALATLIRFLTVSVQPIDLTPWLERDRSRSASAVLLYREARAALSYLSVRRARADGGFGIPVSTRMLLTPLIVVTVSFFPLYLVTGQDWTLTLTYAISLGFIVAVYFAKQVLRRPAVEHAGSSVMSLTANYRRFAATVVHHVEAGALGEKRGVMICIDELDKVIEEGSVRDFLRRMKGIFEVPGVYYYISLAEDTLARLYLAPGEGKNEIDSSLDHIVRVQPLSLDDSEKLVRAYAKRLGFSHVDERLSTIVATVSFGVPRDIIRRCDELISTWTGKLEGVLSVEDPATIARVVRLERVDVASEREGWARETRERLASPPDVAAKAAVEILATVGTERGQRVLALLWTLSMCELAAESKRPSASGFWSRIYRFGYDLPTMPLTDVPATMAELSVIDDGPAAGELREKPERRRPRYDLTRAQGLFDQRRGNGGGNGHPKTAM